MCRIPFSSIWGAASGTVTLISSHLISLSSRKVEKFSSGTNYVERFSWRTAADSSGETGSPGFSAVCYFDEIDLTGYEELSLYVKIAGLAEKRAGDTSGTAAAPGREDAMLTVTLSRPGDEGDYKTALEAAVSVSRLQEAAAAETWQELTVDLSSRTVYFGGKEALLSQLDSDIIPTRLSLALETAWTDDDGSAWYYSSGELSVDELVLTGLKPDILLQNLSRAQWKQDGALLTSRDGSPLISDLSLSAGGSESAVVHTGDRENSAAFAADAKAQATVLGLRLYADGAHPAGSRRALPAGSHRIESAAPLFQALSFSESYSFDAENKVQAKAGSVRLDFSRQGFPLTAEAANSANADRSKQTQSAKASLAFTPRRFALHAGAETSQKLSASAAEREMLSSANYARGWLEGTQLAFSSGKSSAAKRALAFATDASYELPLLHFKPTLAATADGAYISGSSTLFSDKESFCFSLPFTVGRQSFSVSWTKKAGGTGITAAGGGYRRDIRDMQQQAAEKDWFFTALPIQDMVSDSLAERILSDTAGSSSSTTSRYYEGSYSATWKRAVTGSHMDIILPGYLSATFARSIHTASSTSDFFQAKATVGYTALNVFGTAGTVPIAHWFRQDEYSAQGSATLKIPRSKAYNVSMLYTSYVQAAFYVSRQNSFKTGFEASFETKKDWSGKATVIWKRKGKVSPMLGLVDLFSRRELAAHAKLTRTDSLNLAARSVSSTTSSKVTFSYSSEINHQLDMALSDTITLTTAVGGGYTCTQGSLMTLTATASIGASISF